MSPGSVKGRGKGTLVSQQWSTCKGGEMRPNVLGRARSWSALKTGQRSLSLESMVVGPTIGSGAEAGLGPQRWVQGQPGGHCRDPGEDNKGLNCSCVKRKKERRKQRNIAEGGAIGRGKGRG